MEKLRDLGSVPKSLHALGHGQRDGTVLALRRVPARRQPNLLRWRLLPAPKERVPRRRHLQGLCKTPPLALYLHEPHFHALPQSSSQRGQHAPTGGLAHRISQERALLPFALLCDTHESVQQGGLSGTNRGERPQSRQIPSHALLDFRL